LCFEETEQKKVAILIRNKEDQWEGLRSSLGLALEKNHVTMVVLDHEVELTGEYEENLEMLVEMDGEFYSNLSVNVEKYGFKPVTIEELGNKLKEMNWVIAF